MQWEEEGQETKCEKDKRKIGNEKGKGNEKTKEKGKTEGTEKEGTSKDKEKGKKGRETEKNVWLECVICHGHLIKWLKPSFQVPFKTLS